MQHSLTSVAFLLLLVNAALAEKPRKIVIDSDFQDWNDVTTYTDPKGDPHDVEGTKKNYRFKRVNHPDVDILDFKFAHDEHNLYAYFRARGQIGRTKSVNQGSVRATKKRRRRGNRGGTSDRNRPGRYYAILTIDVDQNDETGYWLHEGGYYPSTPGYDVNAEIEWFNGEFNTGHYLNHGCLTEQEKQQAFRDQSQNKYREKNDGPYPAGFMRVKPGTYDFYSQWVYHGNDTITFVRDKGPLVQGIVTGALSEDFHEVELCFPMKGFLKDEQGEPIIAIGRTIDISFSLEASGELIRDGEWASDTADPINGYVLEAVGGDAK